MCFGHHHLWRLGRNVGMAGVSMNEYKDTTRAFPETADHYEGMTLRDYFAAKAMQGAIAHGLFNSDKAKPTYAKYIAKIAYIYADEMMKERNK